VTVTALVIARLDADRAAALLPSLVALLQDAVDGGASVGFLPPLAAAEAEAYWRGLLPEVADGTRLLFAATAGDEVLGSVQLGLAQRANSRHRAEVQKLLVHSRARRQGLGTRLMQTAEAAALAAGRRLLVLDTLLGSPAELVYQRLGYTSCGVIPHYAEVGDGSLQPTHLFYRFLGEA